MKTIGTYKCELKCFKVVPGHDDSLPYIAKLYVNNKYLCSLHNDGWGGETFVSDVQDNELYNKLDKEVRNYIAFRFRGNDYYYRNLESFCDFLAEDKLIGK